jgi:hypothetical protein
MGSSYFITLQSNIPDFDPMMDGKSIAKASETLDEIATSLGVRPLMEFFSANPANVASMLGDDIGDDIELPTQVYFPAVEGLATVQALLAHLRANPDKLHKPESVLDDLAIMEEILLVAYEEGVDWCLDIDF